MSWKRVAEVYAKQVGDHSQRDVLLALAEECRGDSIICYPGVPYLMRKTERSESSVKLALKKLCEREAVSRIDVEVTGRGHFPGFELHLDKLPNKPKKGVKLGPLPDAAPDAEGVKKQVQKGSNFSSEGVKNRVRNKERTGSTTGNPNHHSLSESGKPTPEGRNSSVVSGLKTKSSSKPKKRRPITTPIPADFVAKDTHRIQAAGLNLDADAEVPKFVSYHQGKGTLAADWDAKFSYWLMNEPKFKERRNGNPKGEERRDRNIEAGRAAIAALNKARG